MLNVLFRKIEHPVHHQRQLHRQVAAVATVCNDPGQVVGRGADIKIMHRLDPRARTSGSAFVEESVSLPNTAGDEC